MGICFLGMGDCGNKQETKTKQQIIEETITEIQQECSNNFSTKYEAKTVNNCETTIDQLIETGDIILKNVSDFTLENISKSQMMCEIQAASTAKIQEDITSSVQAAIEKKLGSDIWNKMDKEATSQTGSTGNTQTTETDTEKKTTTKNITKTTIKNDIEVKIAPETIQETKLRISQKNISKSIQLENVSNFKIRNAADAFLQSKAISSAITDITREVLNTQSANEALQIDTKIKNEDSQKAKAGGFAEMFESIGTMFGNIFGGLASGAFGPFMIIIGIIIVIIILFKFAGSSSQQPQQFLPQQFLPQQFPPQQFPPQQFSPQQLPPQQ
jgi:hypothetical protein